MDPNPTPNHGGSVDASQHQHPPLPIAQVGMANKQAQIRATLLGIAGGLASGTSMSLFSTQHIAHIPSQLAFISRKALKLTGNQAILSGMSEQLVRFPHSAASTDRPACTSSCWIRCGLHRRPTRA